MRFPKITLRRSSPRDPEREKANLFEIQAKRDRQRRRIRLLLYFFCAGLLLIGLAGLVFRSPLIRIRSLEIRGNHQMSERDVTLLLHGWIFDTKIKNFFGFRNLLVWPKEIPAEKIKLFPGLKSVTIDKSYLEGKLSVEVVERETYGIWCFMRYEFPRCVWFDPEGIALERAPFAEGTLIIHISDFAQEYPRLSSRVIPAKFLPPLFSIFRVLEEAGIHPLEITIQNLDLEEVQVKTAEGPILSFSLRFSAESTLGVLSSLRSGSMGAKPFRELKYVDFRVEHRAYYK